MDEQRISYVFEDKLNLTLYDYRAYERECPYAPTHTTHQGSLTTPSSDSSSSDSDSSLATSPFPQLTVTDKVASKIVPDINDVMVPVSIKGCERAYQGMMASLPTFVENSTPPDLTDDQLDGITSYFSIPITKVDTRITLPGEKLYLPRIEEGSEDPDLMFGYTTLYVKAFSFGRRLPFSRFVNDLLITLNRAPGQLLPIGGWLNITIFEVACHI
ncbi:hypothetical protein LIER_20615 [Lithospermum erythrorhizon]|uniref:Uncharacterized protein n=1 Tax=Lithospermum erythrorhizon TaxID=34254 RepID=A0AAV3QR86_LITER